MVIAQYLRECGYRVIEAANAEEALTVLKDPAADVQIVFSDIEMPGALDGFSLAQWIRDNRPGIDVLLAGTATRSAQTASDLCDQGPMPKPYHPQSVLDRIKRLIAARNRS